MWKTLLKPPVGGGGKKQWVMNEVEYSRRVLFFKKKEHRFLPLQKIIIFRWSTELHVALEQNLSNQIWGQDGSYHNFEFWNTMTFNNFRNVIAVCVDRGFILMRMLNWNIYIEPLNASLLLVYDNYTLELYLCEMILPGVN